MYMYMYIYIHNHSIPGYYIPPCPWKAGVGHYKLSLRHIDTLSHETDL